jgi:hypothetical protein
VRYAGQDEVMGLYVPHLFDEEVGPQMLNDARELLAAAGPWLDRHRPGLARLRDLRACPSATTSPSCNAAAR